MADVQGTVERPQDLGTSAAQRVTTWLRELQLADRHEKKWRERSGKVVDRYRDEREDAERKKSRFNILFSNTETLRAALYGKTPVPVVRRRYLDKDPVGKLSARILERALAFSLDSYDFDDLMRGVVEDYLLPGRAVARVRYKPTIANGVVLYEEAVCEYVEWEWFRISPAKRWSKVRWIAFGDLLTRDELVAQFGAKGRECKLDWAPKECDEDDEASDLLKRALVWTIWDKTNKRIVVVSKGYDAAPLLERDPPLDLHEFWPIPQPLYSISNTNTLVPVPEYMQYQDQALELDEATARIAALTKAVKRRGIYDSAHPELSRLADAGDNTLIPVENYAALIEKGGLEKLIQEAPIEQIAKVILQLEDRRERLKSIIYETTGISDIVRGASVASETATAQQIKANYGSIRIQPRQTQVARFVRSLLRLKAEIMAENFQPQTLMLIGGWQVIDDAQFQMAQQSGQKLDDTVVPASQWQQAIALLKQDKVRGYRIDIETDSTIRMDNDSERQARVELLAAIGTFVQGIGPAVESGAIPKETALELLLFGVRAFRVSSSVEEALSKIGEQQQPSAKEQQLQAQLQQGAQLVQQMQQQIQQLQDEIRKRDADTSGRIQEANIKAGAEIQKASIAAETDQLVARLETFAATMQTMHERMQTVENKEPDMSPVLDALAQLAGSVQQISDYQQEPKQFQYDDSGNVVAINGRQVLRGPDGRILGVQ